MQVSYSYRGVKTVLEDKFSTPKRGVDGKVTIQSSHYTDGNKKIFTVTIQPHELLSTAKRCLEQLNSIAGTSYQVI